MASISKDKRGHRTIQFVAADKRRRSIRLGKVSQRAAESVKLRVEKLNSAVAFGSALDSDTARWVANLDDKMRDKLARVGLIDKQETAKLESFIDQYVAGRKNMKPASLEVWGQGKRSLIEFFGSESVMRRITAGDADRYKENLIGKGLAPMTIRKRLQFAKTIFRAAQRHKYITENPFADVSIVATMPDRDHFVPWDDFRRLLEAAPDVDWRSIIALSRIGGMRCPSEVLSLRWEDIDWDRKRITITAPKTERYADKGTRVLPLFPELRPILTEAFELAPVGAVYVVNERFRKAANGPKGWRNCNLRTTFLKIVNRAGLTPWPRLFHNMRASRETELMSRFPMHVVVEWLGHSIDIAKKHYCQVTDEHYDLASSALQNPVQHLHALDGTVSQPNRSPNEKRLVLPTVATSCDLLQNQEADGEGFESVGGSPRSSNDLRNLRIGRAAKSGAGRAEVTLVELEQIVQACLDISSSAKADILTILRSEMNRTIS